MCSAVCLLWFHFWALYDFESGFCWWPSVDDDDLEVSSECFGRLDVRFSRRNAFYLMDLSILIEGCVWGLHRADLILSELSDFSVAVVLLDLKSLNATMPIAIADTSATALEPSMRRLLKLHPCSQAVSGVSDAMLMIFSGGPRIQQPTWKLNQ